MPGPHGFWALVEAIENNLGRKPEQASADSGYCSEPNLKALVARGIDGYVAPGRAQHPTAANGKVGGPLTQLMRKKIDDGGFETPYRLRKQVVEPVFGQIKQARGFRQFLLLAMLGAMRRASSHSSVMGSGEKRARHLLQSSDCSHKVTECSATNLRSRDKCRAVSQGPTTLA